MVVSVEPFCHFAGCNSAALLVSLLNRRRTSASDAEIIIDRIAVKIPRSRRKIPEGEAHVEDLIVEREIADRDQIEFCLILPMFFSQTGGGFFQIIERDFSFPV